MTIFLPNQVLTNILAEQEQSITRDMLHEGSTYRVKKTKKHPGGCGVYEGNRSSDKNLVFLRNGDNEDSFCISSLRLSSPFLDSEWQKAFLRSPFVNYDRKQLLAALGENRAGLIASKLSYMLEKESKLQNYLELWFALLFEHHKINYRVNPVIKTRKNFRTPDFYLPDLDRYVEVSVGQRGDKAHLVRDLQWELTADQVCIISRQKFDRLLQENYLDPKWQLNDWLETVSEQASLNRHRPENFQDQLTNWHKQ